jgi:hypothetical protein
MPSSVLGAGKDGNTILRTRALALVAGAILLLGLSVPSVSAGGVTELLIGQNMEEIAHSFVTDDEGATWSDNPEGCCYASYSELAPGVPDAEARTALEFPLSALPDGATIEWVELRLSAHQLSSVTFAIYTYPGNGAITDEDVGVTGTPYPSVFTTAGEREMVYFAEDIPAPIMAAGWIGFSIRLDPLLPASVGWISPESEVSDLDPILAIGYTAPAGSQVPDAAMSAPATRSPLLVTGLIVLLVAGLVAMATVRGRRPAS